MLVRAVKDVLLPEDNLFPPSLHICEGLAGVEALDKYTYHVCSCGKHVYNHVPKESWHLHYGDSCPVCNSPRFVKKTVANTTSWEPEKVCIFKAQLRLILVTLPCCSGCCTLVLVKPSEPVFSPTLCLPSCVLLEERITGTLHLMQRHSTTNLVASCLVTLVLVRMR